MENNTNLTDKAYELIQLLASKGCKTIYQSDENEDFQTLMLDGNSGTIFSVETLPWRNSAEIRTNRNQHSSFPTEDIVNRLITDAPLFSDYTVTNYWDIPFVSVAQENKLLSFAPMFVRIDALPGGPAEAAFVYYTTGTVPGVTPEVLLATELEYQRDVDHFNFVMNSIIDERMSLLPQAVQDFYSYHGNESIDIYDVTHQKKR